MEQNQEVGLHFLDYWRVIRSRKEIIVAVTLLVVLTGFALTLTQPKEYRSRARIQVRDDSLDVPVFGPDTGGWGSYNPYFLRTQYEIIQSRPILDKVAKNLGLARIWGELYNQDKSPLDEGSAYRILAGMVTVAQSRDTSLIEIMVQSRSPEEAARIANEIADVYRSQRLELKMRELSRGVEAMEQELLKKQDDVKAAEQKVEQLRKDLKISEITTGFRVDKMRLQQLEADRIAARVDTLSKKARMDSLVSLPDDQLAEASANMVADPEIISLRRQLAEMELRLRQQLEITGEENPEVKFLKAGVEESQKKLKAALEGFRQSVRVVYAESEARYKALEEELQKAKDADIASQSDRFLPFDKAQKDLEQEQLVFNALKARVAQEKIQNKIPRTPVEIVDPAVPVPVPVSPNMVLNIIVSLVLGLLLGIGLAYFIEYLDTSVKTVDDVEKYLGLPVVGVIPQKVRPLIEEGPDSPHAEAYRVLRTNIQFSNKSATGGAFAVMSGGVGEGKSTTAFNLAYVCATMGDKVLIVDSDLRRPVQHSILGIQNRFGLTNVLMRDVPIEETIKPVPNVPNLHFLPSGKLPRSSIGILNSQRMRELVKTLKTRYDYVFFDSPPVVGISDASIMASEVDGVLLVVQYRKYPRIMSSRAKRMIENVGGKLIGVVLNNINIMRDDYYYYYHSYYSGYYHQAPGADKGAAAAPASKTV